MEQSVINRIRDKAVAASRNCSCEDILIKSGLSYRRRGNQLYFFCPECDREQFLVDQKERHIPYQQRTFSAGDIPDHCSVNVSKNMYFCFTCSQIEANGKKKNAGGGAAKLYSIIYSERYIDAALMLAEKCKAITEEEMSKAFSSADAIKKLKKASENIEMYEEYTAGKEAEVKAPARICNAVYRALLSLPEFSLTRDHYEYLRSERKLTDKEIKDGMFFSYHACFDFKELFQRCVNCIPDFSTSMLYGVPGFFFETKSENRGVWHFKKPLPNSVGIPLRNSRGEIVALQMRNLDKKSCKNKYFYISSKYESQKNKNYGYGSSPGSPVAVCYPPDLLKIPTFYIGEGFFKMREIAKEGAVTFSVQGVNSLSYVPDEIMQAFQLLPRLKTSLTGQNQIKLVIVFDSDMYSNIQVLEAALRAAVMLEEKFPGRPVSFLLWKDEYGKGFDDMKFNCISRGIDYTRKVAVVGKNVFLQVVRDSIQTADKIFKNNHSTMNIMDRRSDEYASLLYNILYVQRISTMLP